MRFMQLKNDLYLIEQEITKTEIKKVPDQIQHVWLYDRSGSMYSYLKDLTEDLIDRAKQLPVGDTLTLGWFSSEGQYNFIVKGYKITDIKDYGILETAIRKNNTTIGLTCFSDILGEVDTVVKDLSVISTNFALVFFTDGYPVVSDYGKEIEKIQTAIKNVQGVIGASLLVGYGHYYNKLLMAEMAEQLGGSLTHSDGLDQFSVALTSFLLDARETGPKVVIKPEVSDDYGVIFGINGKQINLYAKNSAGEVTFAPSKKSKDCLYILSKKAPANGKLVVLDDKNTKGDSVAEGLVKAAYAAAFVLCQKTKTDLALEVLAPVGDIAAIDALTNAFTPSEYGVAEDKLKTFMASPSKRFSKGRSTTYLPKEDAFSLLDVVFTLQLDETAYFYPRNKAFSYKRITAETKPQTEEAAFKASEDCRCPVSTLTWNASKLNLSVLARIEGHVEFDEGYEAVGFQKQFPTNVYRNYTLIKDGGLNVQTLPVSTSEETFQTLKVEGLVDGPTWAKDVPYILNLNRVPVINRAAANGKTSATELCQKVWKEWQLKGTIKALKNLRDRESPEAVTTKLSGLSVPQMEYLSKHHVTANGFSPPTTKAEATDYYIAKEFTIKVKGVSSLPKVEDVELKLATKKPLKPSEELVALGLNSYASSGFTDAPQKAKDGWFLSNLALANSKLQKVRKEIQETKFSVLLGKAWFAEFSSREENTLEVDGKTFTIEVKEVKVNY